MKKKIALVMALIMCVSLLSGCSAGGDPEETSKDSGESGFWGLLPVSPDPAETETAAADPSTNPDAGPRVPDQVEFPLFTSRPAAPDTTPGPAAEPAEYMVPSVLGRTLEELENNSLILGDFKLVVDGIVFSENYREGQICEQSPEAGTIVRKGEMVITVKISGGPEKMYMPSVAGWDVREALRLLQDEMGLSVNIQYEFSDTVTDGYVTRFSPMEGTPVEKGDKVTIWVSKGPEVLKVTVPDLLNARLEDAQRQITSAGLTPGTVNYFPNDEYPEGRVFWQSITPYTEVDKGSVIDLWVSKGPLEAGPGELRSFTTNTTGRDSTLKDKQDGFTLLEGQSWQMRLTFDPADWSGEVTYSVSDTRYATVSADGVVTNVNPDSALHMVYLTITAGDLTLIMPIYCRGVSASDPPASDPSASQTPSGSGTVTVGKQGTIVNTPSGVYVRSGPGAAYDRIGSLFNGDPVTVLEDAGNGWYKITFSGAGGAVTEGYVKDDYISTD